MGFEPQTSGVRGSWTSSFATTITQHQITLLHSSLNVINSDNFKQWQ